MITSSPIPGMIEHRCDNHSDGAAVWYSWTHDDSDQCPLCATDGTLATLDKIDTVGTDVLADGNALWRDLVEILHNMLHELREASADKATRDTLREEIERLEERMAEFAGALHDWHDLADWAERKGRR